MAQARTLGKRSCCPPSANRVSLSGFDDLVHVKGLIFIFQCILELIISYSTSTSTKIDKNLVVGIVELKEFVIDLSPLSFEDDFSRMFAAKYKRDKHCCTIY